MLKVEALEAIRNPHQVRILLLLRERGPMRFNEIQRALELNPAQVDRALKKLDDGFWVYATTIPGTADYQTYSILVDYRLSKKGNRLAAAFDAFVDKLRTEPLGVGQALIGLYPE